MDKLKKTINDIEYGKYLLQNRPEHDTVDYKLYDILNNALELLIGYKNKTPLIQWLLQLNENELSLAIVYAQNYIKTGEDVTQKWETAVQNVSALERAEKNGYMACMREMRRRAKDGEQE